MKIPSTDTQADELLRRKCEIALEHASVSAIMNASITAAREHAKRETHPLAKEEAAIDAALAAYFERRRKSLGAAKSLPLTFGTIGVRAAKGVVALLRGFKVEQVIENLKNRRLARCLRLKEELDKEAIHAAAADPRAEAQLRECGIRILPGQESFYVDLNMDAL